MQATSRIWITTTPVMLAGVVRIVVMTPPTFVAKPWADAMAMWEVMSHSTAVSESPRFCNAFAADVLAPGSV